METIQFFWQHAWRYKPYVIGILVTTPLAILFHTFFSSLIIADILQRLSSGSFTPNDLVGSFGASIALFITIYLIGNVILYRILTFLMWQLDRFVSRDIANQTYSHLLAMDVSFHAAHFGGALVAAAGRLTSVFERLAYTTVYSTAPLILVFVFASIVLLPRVPFYVGILLILALLYIYVAVLSAKKIRHFNTAEAAARSKQSAVLADGLTNVMTVKSFGYEADESRLFKKTTDQAVKASSDLMKAILRRDTHFSLIGSCFSIAAVILVIVSVMFLHADIATAFLMFTYSVAIARALWDFSSKSLRDYNRALGDASEMISILHRTPSVADPAEPKRLKITKGEIFLDNITFLHPDATKPLFHNFALSIAPGEKVGLVGRSGSGKTTLTKLLLRFADPKSGEILIDGRPIKDVSQKTLRDSIAYVPQEPLLFHRTIGENIAYGKPNATPNEIVAAAKKANAYEFIKDLPHGFGTLVGERGIKLSGGQRQRITIARAILKDAPILILDEATAALDSESEKLIQDALQKLMANRTTIVVAHRLSTISRMDRIVVLDKGQVKEQGSHQELLNQGGTYAKLWSHQSGGFIKE